MAGGPFDGAVEMARNEVGMKMRTAAVGGGEKMHSGFINVMNKFYSESPHRCYSNTYSLFEAEEGVGGGKICFNKKGVLEWEVGLYIDDARVPDVYSGTGSSKGYASLAYVTHKAFDEGVHGFDEGMRAEIEASWPPARYWYFPPKSSPPATEMEKYVDQVVSYINGVIGL